MKRTHTALLCLAIVLLTAATGWWQKKRFVRREADHRLLIQRATLLGLRVPGADRRLVAAVTKRQREDEAAEALLLAEELIEIANGLAMDDEAGRRKMLEVYRKIHQLNEAQLVLVNERMGKVRLVNSNLRSEVLFTLSGKNPETTLRLVGESSEPKEYTSFIVQNAVKKRAEFDPESALNWLKDHKAGKEINTSDMLALISGAMKKDVRQAFEIWENSCQTAISQSTYADIVRMSATPEDGLEVYGLVQKSISNMADANKAKHERSAAASRLMDVLLNEDGTRGRDLLNQAKLGETEKKAIADDLGNRSDLADSGGWLKWIEMNLPPDAAIKPVQMVMRRWAQKDYPAATNWLNNLPASPMKNVAVRQFAETVAYYDPEGAADWADTLPEGYERQETYRNIFDNWPKDEPGKEEFKAKHGL